MNPADIWSTYGQPVANWLMTNGQPLFFGAGSVGAILMIVLVWRFLSRGELHAKLGGAAVTVATLFAMEGMYEVASGPLGLNMMGSLIFCATFEIVMLHQGTLAAHKLAANPAADVTRHMRFVWIVAAGSGLIASTASDSVTEVVLRLATPPLAAGIWYMSLYADKPTAEREESQWIWTPQRIGVRLGLLKPGTVDDLTEVFRRRRAAALVDAAMTLLAVREAGDSGKRVAAASAKLQRLAKDADRDTVTAAQEQLRIVRNAEAVLLGQTGEISNSERDLLDEVRLTMRAATDRLRSDHRRAFGQDQPLPSLLAERAPEPMWSNPVVRMPERLAKQIPPPPPARQAEPPVDIPLDDWTATEGVRRPPQQPPSDGPADGQETVKKPSAEPSAETPKDRQDDRQEDRQNDRQKPPKRTVKKPSRGRQLTAAEKVAAAVEKLGADASLSALMKESGVSESSVLRHRPKPAAAVNGHNHPES